MEQVGHRAARLACLWIGQPLADELGSQRESLLAKNWALFRSNPLFCGGIGIVTSKAIQFSQQQFAFIGRLTSNSAIAGMNGRLFGGDANEGDKCAREKPKRRGSQPAEREGKAAEENNHMVLKGTAAAHLLSDSLLKELI